MKKKTRWFMLLLAGVVAMLCISASAHAQSFLIINNSGCIQWIHVKNSNGRWAVRKALNTNADITMDNARGTGITLIGGGPTAAIEDCCYSRRINASVSLDGTNWRIDINPSGLRVINRESYEEVFSAAGDFSRCVPAAGGAMGGTGIGQQPQPLTTRGQ